MAKLYLFSIGGTGVRVMRAFTFLLAAGVKPKGFSEVVPVIIDADKRCGDKDLAVKALQDYMSIQEYVNSDSENQNKQGEFNPAGSFFQTRITPICEHEGHKDFLMNVFGTGSEKSFANYIDFDNLDENTQRIIKLLFTTDNLKANMDVGFKGNPNMGSVVLNGFDVSDDFKRIKSSFQSEDSIFIISSIFGGTGASGFPLLLNTINKTPEFKGARTGAITVLPYFKAKEVSRVPGIEENGKNQLDTSTFLQKTKAALAYYEKHVEHNLDALYYIGDKKSPEYENHDGGAAQINPPHFVEFAAALAVFHFAENASNKDSEKDKTKTDVRETSHFEYGVEHGSEEGPDNINFINLPRQTRELVMKEMSAFLLAANFLRQNMEKSWNYSWVQRDPSFLPIKDNDFIKKLESITKDYRDCLIGLTENSNRSLSLFKLKTAENRIFDIISGKEHNRSFLDKIFGSNYIKFTTYLDKQKRRRAEIEKFEALESKFLYTLNKVSEQLYKEELEDKK